MTWQEFCALLSGLSEKSSLAKIVEIRLENDPKILKNFTFRQRKIRSEWRSRAAKYVSKQETNDILEKFKQAFISMSK